MEVNIFKLTIPRCLLSKEVLMRKVLLSSGHDSRGYLLLRERCLLRSVYICAIGSIYCRVYIRDQISCKFLLLTKSPDYITRTGVKSADLI